MSCSSVKYIGFHCVITDHGGHIKVTHNTHLITRDSHDQVSYCVFATGISSQVEVDQAVDQAN